MAAAQTPGRPVPVAGATAAPRDSLPAPGTLDSLKTPPAPAGLGGPAPADTTPRAPEQLPTIGSIRVVGNASVDSARILRTFEIPSGMTYSSEAVRRGIRKLFALGLFEDVWVETLERPGFVDLLIHVSERPRISKIELTGNRKKETSDLEKKLFLHAGDVYSPTTAQTQVDSLVKHYREEGYARVSIEAAADTNRAANTVLLRFVIREGEKVRITRIAMVGVRAIPEKKARKALKTRPHGLFGGGEIKEESEKDDREKLEAYYHERGYRDMRVTGYEVGPGRSARDLTLTVTVEEGRFYWMGKVAWTGNTVLSTETLTKFWVPKAGDRYDATKIQKTREQALGEYAEHGYLFLGIEPEETPRDSLVDVTFVVAEGKPSNIRLVNIAGNKGTREKVIRREIDVHEGDRFKRSTLIRTQGDVYRLGLFEDVKLDFSEAESSDVDLNIRVKEKQVGTASAGAGYTGTAGLTGFLELGHNNVLGNGQSASIHLERGSRTSDYLLSFTEPWFRDTPTLLGFSVFNTQIDRDIYREKRVGGSGRIGRPLPWPDYSRGSFTYRLENVTISEFSSTDTAQKIALQGLKPGKPVLTSSAQIDYLRNSADSPFYPTKGSRLSLNSELAGGPFGGSVNFHKHRIEGRVWLPSLFKGVSTMVRARVGLLGEYGDQNLEVPIYERFRMGGGSTVDPLRGYDDYQVVPEKFVRDIVLKTGTIDHIDSVTTPGVRDTVYKTFTERVRYPGGRTMLLYSVEQQFPIVAPLHGVLFFDAGNTWDLWREIKPWDLKMGAGLGFRMEIPLLGNIGFDYGYGFNRDDGARWVGHFLLGNVNF